MADTEVETLQNGTGGALSEEDERTKQRPADIDADVREMERRKRVEALMSSRLFREELERVLDQQLVDGGDAPLLQRIKEMVGGRLHTGSMRGPSCVLPINDIRGIEGIGYEKGEKILRCKLAAVYRLIDLFGWTQSATPALVTARLNTAGEQLLVAPRGLMPHEVTASALVKVDMQGAVLDPGTTNYGVQRAGFSVHAAVHAARPDIRCVVHARSPAVLALSALAGGLLPLCTEAALLGDVAYHRLPPGVLDESERDKLVRVLGPSSLVLVLRGHGALCGGRDAGEALHVARLLHAAADTQLRMGAANVPREALALLDDDERREIYLSARAEGTADNAKWRPGSEEFEALMRMLDNAGFRTGYIYRNPLIKNEVPRPKNDVEVPPAVSSLGYLLEEEEMYRQGLWKKGQGKTGERTRWLNSPNVYQKVEVLETGTNDPKKITKWVDANNEEWVQDGSPAHSSTPMKIDAALQFVPKNTNPKEFKKLQQQIKDNRRADKISAGPQSHILEGVTWDEANKLNDGDATATHAGDHVVLVGAASKGIIQRGFQHHASVYSAPYARNPFDDVSQRDLDDYTRRAAGYPYDTDLSESEAISAAQMTSPVSETEEESRDEHRVLRIETKHAPTRSQPEVVLSDDSTDFLNAERTHVDSSRGTSQSTTLTNQSKGHVTSNKNPIYSRSPNFDELVKKYDVKVKKVSLTVRQLKYPSNDRPKLDNKLELTTDNELKLATGNKLKHNIANDKLKHNIDNDNLKNNTDNNDKPKYDNKLKLNTDNNLKPSVDKKRETKTFVKQRLDSDPAQIDSYNPDSLSSRNSLKSVSSLEWDAKRTAYNLKTQSLPRNLKSNERSLSYRSRSHSGFINSFVKNPEPMHFHIPKCRKCGTFNSSYDFEIAKRDLKALGLGSVSYENIHKTCLKDDSKAMSDIVRVKGKDDSEFIESEEYSEDCYLDHPYMSNTTMVASLNSEDTIVENEDNKENLDLTKISVNESGALTNPELISANDAVIATLENDNANDIIKEDDKVDIEESVETKIEYNNENFKGDALDYVYRAECVFIEGSDDSNKTYSIKTESSPDSIKTNVSYETYSGVNKKSIECEAANVCKKLNFYLSGAVEDDTKEAKEVIEVDSPFFVNFTRVLKELKEIFKEKRNLNKRELKIDAKCSEIYEEGEYLNFSNELDFDKAVYESPVQGLINKDVRDFLVPLRYYEGDYVRMSPNKFDVSKTLEPIAEETKASDSSNDSVKIKDNEIKECSPDDLKVISEIGDDKVFNNDDVQNNEYVRASPNKFYVCKTLEPIAEETKVSDSSNDSGEIESVVGFKARVENDDKVEECSPDDFKIIPEIGDEKVFNNDVKIFSNEEDKGIEDHVQIDKTDCEMQQILVDKNEDNTNTEDIDETPESNDAEILSYEENKEIENNKPHDVQTEKPDCEIRQILDENKVNINRDNDETPESNNAEIFSNEKDKGIENNENHDVQIEKTVERGDNEVQINTDNDETPESNSSNNETVVYVDLSDSEHVFKEPQAPDASKLRSSDNFKFSIDSSTAEVPSFDSTTEFEKTEAVSDVLDLIIKRVSLTIANMSEYNFYNTLEIVKNKNKQSPGKFFDTMKTNEEIENIVTEHSFNESDNIEIALNETNLQKNEIISDVEDKDENKNEPSTEDIQTLTEDNKPETFSITEIIESIEQQVMSTLSLTVLTDNSDLDPKTHPLKVCEGIVYHLFNLAYYTIMDKCKEGRAKAKTVVTVVDSEDILYTALSLWVIESVEQDFEMEQEFDGTEKTESGFDLKHNGKISNEDAVIEEQKLDTAQNTDTDIDFERDGGNFNDEAIKDFDLCEDVQDLNVESHHDIVKPEDIANDNKTNNVNEHIGATDILKPNIDNEIIAYEELREILSNVFESLDSKVSLTIDGEQNNDVQHIIIEQNEALEDNEDNTHLIENEKGAANTLSDLPANEACQADEIDIELIIDKENDDAETEGMSKEQIDENFNMISENENSEDIDYLYSKNLGNEKQIESNMTCGEVINLTEELLDLENVVDVNSVPADENQGWQGIREPYDTILIEDVSTETTLPDMPIIDVCETAPSDKDPTEEYPNDKQEANTEELRDVIGVQEDNLEIDNCENIEAVMYPNNNSHNDNQNTKSEPKNTNEDIIIESEKPCNIENFAVMNTIPSEEFNEIQDPFTSVDDVFEGEKPCDLENVVVINAISSDECNDILESCNTNLNEYVDTADALSDLPTGDACQAAATYEDFNNEDYVREDGNVEEQTEQDDTQEQNCETFIVNDNEEVNNDVLQSNNSFDNCEQLEITENDELTEKYDTNIDAVIETEILSNLENLTPNDELINEDSVLKIPSEEIKVILEPINLQQEESDCLVSCDNLNKDQVVTIDVNDNTKLFDSNITEICKLNEECQTNPVENEDFIKVLSRIINYSDNKELTVKDSFDRGDATPKSVDNLSPDDISPDSSVTYNSHILQTIVENLLQDVLAEFVFDGDDGPSQKEEGLAKELDLKVDSKEHTYTIHDYRPPQLTPNASYSDFTYISAPDTSDLNETYVLGNKDTNIIEDDNLDTETSYLDTAFCEDTMLTNQSSPYNNNSLTFTSCDESPIKSANRAYLDDSGLYDKLEMSPFDKKVPIISMSQTVNTGGLKYWVSFDDSYVESKCPVKGRKSRDVPTFISFDAVDDDLSKKIDRKISREISTESSCYVTASGSKTNTFISCNNEPNIKLTGEEKKLIFDCSKSSFFNNSKKFNTWPPYDETLFYRLISKFRMTESFDLSRLDFNDLDDP